ncbi:MAG TPA: hypothetical protein VF316_08325 [Polyangiaceae bacterium]
MSSKAGSAAATLALLIGGVAGIALTQPSLARTLHDTKAREDVYLFPPPAQLQLLTLGHSAAAVDQLWVKLRIEFGIHFSEHRAFPDVYHYVDAIIALEPDFAPVYKYADTLILYSLETASEDDARRVHDYLERGTKERPGDHEVWLHYGQFLAFSAPSYVHDPTLLESWRKEGALAISRSIELGEDADRSLSVAYVLNKAGEHDAAVRSVRRAFALTDDPAVREQLAAQLARLEAVDEQEAAQDDARFVDDAWHRDYPFLSRGSFLLLAPRRDTLRCAGPGHETADCSTDWHSVLPSANRGIDR